MLLKKKNLKIIIFFFFFGCIKSFACDCNSPMPILEFYSSKYVFEGLVTSKTFTKDSATYSIKVKVLKSYKTGNIPEELSFTFYYKKENSVGSSCYSEVYKNQKLLVFASEYKGKLSFYNMCSNSQVILERGIDPFLQKVLDHGNEFKLDDYIYDQGYREENEFEYKKPISSLNSLFKKGKIKDYENRNILLALYVDEKGKLISVSTAMDMNYSESEFVYDPIFRLLIKFSTKSKRPLNDLQIDAIDLLKGIENWGIKRHTITKIPVKYIQYISIEFDAVNKKWKYEI